MVPIVDGRHIEAGPGDTGAMRPEPQSTKLPAEAAAGGRPRALPFSGAIFCACAIIAAALSFLAGARMQNAAFDLSSYAIGGAVFRATCGPIVFFYVDRKNTPPNSRHTSISYAVFFF